MAAGRPAAPDPEVESGTLDDFAATYFRAKSPVLSTETIRNRDDDYRLRIGPALGGLNLSDVSRERVEVWLAELSVTASSRRMIVQSVATLRVILGTAVEWGRLADNPATKLRIPAVETHAEQAVERVIDVAQMASLFASAGSLRTETMLRAAGEAGLRRGEVAGLRWPDVDLAARRLDIRRSVVQERARDGVPMRKTEKTPKGRRSRRVAISESFSARLGDWYADSVVVGGEDASGYVWPGKDGGPMHDRSLARSLERACDRAGLVANPDRGKAERPIPLVTPHGLRHSCASIMLSHGVPLIVVSRQLGHANPNITATIYAHLLGDSELDRAADAFRFADVHDLRTERASSIE